MAPAAYNACATFPSSLQATCQLSRSCTTLASSVGFSLSMPSPAFSPFGFSTAYHFSPSSLSLSPTLLLLMSLSLYQNVSSKYTGLTTKMHPQNELFLPAALHVVTAYVTLRLYGILYPALWNLQMPP